MSDAQKYICFNGSMQEAESNYQNCWYRQYDYEFLQRQLDYHQEARRQLEKIDEAECSISAWDAIWCAIQIITRPEDK